MLLVVGSTGEKPPAGVWESWLFVFLPSDYAPGEARCGHPKQYRLYASLQPEREVRETVGLNFGVRGVIMQVMACTD